MPELTEQQSEQLHDWRMVLTDVRYALRQLIAALKCCHCEEGECSRCGRDQRAVDALERVEATADRRAKE